MKHKTRTKALSWLLSLAMVLSLLPGLSIPARAAATELPAAVNGVIKLTGDVELSSTWVVSGTVTLDLNDYGIRLTGSGSVIKVPSDASLTITDSSTSKTTRYIPLTSGRGTAVSTVPPGSGSYVTVSGGYITGGTGTTNGNSRYGGGVYSEGTLTLSGGTICGNTASKGGGGVYNAGTFTITGGTIADNEVGNQYSGGGVYNNGTFVMNGGAISNNKASYGAGVRSMYGCTFTMNDGSINNNEASNGYGGGVDNKGLFEMKGGSISGNRASYGGGVNSGNWMSPSTYGYGSFVMTGGTISGNTASSVGAAFRKDDSSTTVTIGADNKAVIATVSTDGSGDKLTYNASDIENYGYIAVVPTYTYRAASVDATTHAVSFTDETCTDYTTVTDSTTAVTWNSGWYVVSGNVTVDMRITVTGTVNLILCDGATLTANEGITVANDNSLTIYGQSAGTGELKARSPYVYAAIGGDSTYNEEPDFHYLSNKAGTIVINGGKVTATDTDNGAGIGNYSSDESAGTLIVNGGTVIATGGEKGAGIGGGENSAGMAVTINGGTVTATGRDYGAGIGGGKNGNGGSFAIYGGAVTANGGQYAGAGIGGGSYGDDITGSTVAIHGGQVTASSGQYSFVAAIDCRKTSLTVSGGTVTANGKYYNGIDASSGTITVSGGSVTATSGGEAGINVGENGRLNVTGGTVTAAGGTGENCKGMIGPITLGNGMYLYGSDAPNPENELTNYVAKVNDDYARYKYMTVNNVTPHNHTLSNFHSSGDTITATCDASGCTLPETDGNHIATLTIAPKSDGTATLTGGADFGKTDADIVYTKDGQPTTADAIKSSQDAAFYTAKITVSDGTQNYDASVAYGVNAVKKAAGYDAAAKHGDFTPPTIAAIGATVTVDTTPDAGYELESLTVTKADNGTVNVTKDDNSGTFTMPSETVTVDAAFRAIDYTVTVNSTTNGTVTASKTSTAHVGDEITLTVTPAEGYAVDVITVKDASNHDVIVENRAFTMPASNVTVNVTFAELTTYTIFYRASGNPTSVRVRLSNSGDGVAMAPSAKLGAIDCWAIQVEAKTGINKLPVAFKVGDGEWSALNTEQGVGTDIPGSLDAGSAAVIEGEAKAFVVAFTWGDLTKVDGTDDSYLPVDNSTKHFLVTNNTASVSVTPPAKTGYTFRGWEYSAGQNVYTTGTSESVSLANVSETTVFSALWELNTCNVTYDLNGGSSENSIETVSYGQKAVNAPANPTRDGYSFVRWVVAESVTEIVGNEKVRLSAGTAFDFNNTGIINDLKLKAEWKHVHSYVCLPLNHAAFGDAFSEYVKAGYGDYMHVRICTSMDDYCAEAHSFGSNGKCACGATKPTPTVTLQKQIDDQTPSTTQVTKDSVVVLGAPNISGKTFSKWEYNDGANWRSLTTSPYAAFVIPSNLQVKAEYSSPSAEVSIESFDYKGNIAFYFSYKVPDGYTVLDGGILFGNNSHLRYMLAKTPKESMDLSISGAVQYFAPIPSAVEAPVYYEVAKDNAVNKFGAANVATKIFREEALNVSGKSNPIFKKVSSLGKAGTAAIAVNSTASNIYYYGMGYVICRAPDNSLRAFWTNAIAATKGNPNNPAQAKTFLTN